MLRKILKIFSIILVIGFISAFIRGYKYHSDKDKTTKQDTNIVMEKQDIIDEDTIQEILSTNYSNNETSNEVKKKDNNISNNPNQKNNSNNNEVKTNIETKEEKTVETTKNNSQIETVKEEKKEEVKKENTNTNLKVANPNDFYYSFHLGKVEFKNMDKCLNAFAILNVRNDDTDLLTGTCIDVIAMDGSNLGEYLNIECESGNNCNRFKDLIKDLIGTD